MTQDEIIEMAMEAEFVSHGKPSDEESELFVCVDKDIYKFAALVAAKEREACADAALKAAESSIVLAMKIEREACAKVAEQFEPDEKTSYVTYASTAIRARGQA